MDDISEKIVNESMPQSASFTVTSASANMPQKFQCPTCQYVMTYSPNERKDYPNVMGGELFCPMCYKAFLRSNIPVMELVTEQS